MPRIIICFWSLLAVLLVSPQISRADEYAFILKSRGNPFWKVVAQGIRETAEKRGITASIYQLESDQDSEGQLNLCLTALERKPKAMVLAANVKTTGIKCYREAMQRGIPAGDVDGNLSVEEAAKDGVKLSFSVGSDNYSIGKKAAEYVKGIVKTTTPKVLAITGLPGNIVSQQRASGFQDGLKEYLPQAKLVASLAADWDRLKAANITADMLHREEHIDVIFSASDVMTYGIIESVKTAGKAGEVAIVSVDGNADVRDAIEKGKVAASVAQLPYLMGKRAVEMSIDTAAGKTVPAAEYTGTPVLTREVLAQKADPSLEYVR